MVPPAGIEPALPKERDFESRASTSSARGATDTGEGAYHGPSADASARSLCCTTFRRVPDTSRRPRQRCDDLISRKLSLLTKAQIVRLFWTSVFALARTIA